MSAAPRLPAAAVRPSMRLLQRRVFDPSVPWGRQRRILELAGRVARPPRGTEVTTTTLGGVRVERLGVGPDPGRVVLHFHGGGYTVGGAATCRGWAARLAALSGTPVLVPEYRLAPEHPAPAASADALAVWAAVTATVPPGSVALSGDSAGAGLALGLAQRLAGSGRPGPASLLLLSPWLDLDADRRIDPGLVARDCLLTPGWLEACAAAYAPDRSLADPAVSPLFGPLTALPPVLVQVGADDILVGDADRLVAGLRAVEADVVYSRVAGLWHDYPLQAGTLAAADRAVVHAARWLSRWWVG